MAVAGTFVAMAVPYTIPTSTYYYVGVCITAGTMPTFCGDSSMVLDMANNYAPALWAQSSTGQTTPPATGTTMGALSAVRTTSRSPVLAGTASAF